MARPTLAKYVTWGGFMYSKCQIRVKARVFNHGIVQRNGIGDSAIHSLILDRIVPYWPIHKVSKSMSVSEV